MDKVQFGVTYPEEQDYALLGEYSWRVEQLGFDSLWATDNIFSGCPAPEIFTAVALMAAHTSRIKVGTSVAILPPRNPGRVAQAVATLDVVTRGRVILGVGVGSRAGNPVEPVDYNPQRRGKRFEEQIQVMKMLWTESPVSFDGEFYRFNDVTLLPRPVQQPHPPIWLGGKLGGSDDRVLRRAARLADAYIPAWVTPEYYTEIFERIGRYAAEYGRDLSTMTRALHIYTCLANTPEEAARISSEVLSNRYGYPASPPADNSVLFGTPDRCRQILAEFIEAGATHIVMNPTCRPDDVEGQLEILAQEVVPALT